MVILKSIWRRIFPPKLKIYGVGSSIEEEAENILSALENANEDGVELTIFSMLSTLGLTFSLSINKNIMPTFCLLVSSHSNTDLLDEPQKYKFSRNYTREEAKALIKRLYRGNSLYTKEDLSFTPRKLKFGREKL